MVGLSKEQHLNVHWFLLDLCHTVNQNKPVQVRIIFGIRMDKELMIKFVSLIKSLLIN